MSINAALANDVPEMMRVRFLVKENVLSNPALVTPDDCLRHITTDGFGFCWHEGGQLLGFSIANHIVGNVWALFVDPAHEGRGIGRALHDALLDKYFASHEGPIMAQHRSGHTCRPDVCQGRLGARCGAMERGAALLDDEGEVARKLSPIQATGRGFLGDHVRVQ
jgi:GNAT superfamily N-acetyltransferase